MSMDYKKIIELSQSKFVSYINKNKHIINQKNDNGLTLLFLCLYNKMHDKALYLLSNNANVNTIVFKDDFGVVNALDVCKMIDDEEMENIVREYSNQSNNTFNYLKKRKIIPTSSSKNFITYKKKKASIK